MQLPAWMRSVRFRLALTYSIVVFGLAAVVILSVNLALSRSLTDQPVSRQTQFTTFVAPSGAVVTIEETVQGRFVTLEQLVNQRARDNLRRFSVWALLGMFPLSIVVGWIIADRALSPIGDITRVAREIESSDLSQRIRLHGPDDELKDLADTFDAMLDRVEAGIDAQRAFIQDASHELRNPLAVMAANLDVVLADDEADLGEYRSTAEVVRRSVDRTARTVDDLVLYARRDIPDISRREVQLEDLADEVLQEFQGVIEGGGLEVRRSTEPVVAVVEEPSMKRALGNVVGNAVRLAPSGTTIDLAVGRHRDWAYIGLADRGPGIAPRDHGSVFQRNWSRDDSSVGGEARSGLGLAITRQVAESHGGLVTLSSALGDGASFVIWIPMAASSDRNTVTEDGIHPVWDPFSG